MCVCVDALTEAQRGWCVDSIASACAIWLCRRRSLFDLGLSAGFGLSIP